MLRIAFPIIIMLTLASFGVVHAQADGGNPIEKRGFYRTHNVYGAYLHTGGMGLYYRKGWRNTGFSNKILNIEVLTVKHPKEFKLSSLGNNNVRNYYFGKINSVGFVRSSYGFQKTLFDKEVEKGVRVSSHFLFGPTLAFVKPVYLIVNVSDLDRSGDQIMVYDYDEIVRRGGSIKGRAPFLQGISETKVRLGLHLKYGLTFEFSKDDESIKALETGFTFDGFVREIPIMAKTYNNRFFVNFYIAYHFGKRSL